MPPEPDTATPAPTPDAPAPAEQRESAAGESTPTKSPTAGATQASGGPTPSPSAASSDATLDAPAPAPPAGEAKGAQAAPAAPDWREALEAADPRELRKHPKLAGIVGSMLEAERARLRQEAEAAVTRRAQDERLRQLRQSDPEAYVREVEQQEQEAGRSQAIYGGVQARLAAWQQTLPDEVQAKVAGKTYPGAYEDGVVAYARELAETLAEHRAQEAVDAARKRWEADVRPAIRQELLAELNAGDPAPDTGGSQPAGGRPDAFTFPEVRKRLRSMSPDEFEKNKKEIYAAYGIR